MSPFRDWYRKEAPVFTGISRGVGGYGFGRYVSAVSAAASATGVSRSLRFSSPSSKYLSLTPSVAGNRRTWTWAGWVKRSALGSRQNVFGTGDASFYNGFWLEFFSNDCIRIGDIGASTLDLEIITTQVFRDPSSWGHLVVAVDTTQSTNSNRIKVYWNGSQITAFSTATYPTQNFDTRFNTTAAHGIGRAGSYNGQYFSGYLADVYFIDGQALDPSSFTTTDATTGQLIPKAFSGSYGSNGWHLDFADNSAATATTLGKDSAGSNNWTPNNFSVTAGAGNDSLVDVPVNGAQTDTGVGGEVRGNYCTLNPLDVDPANGCAISNGNLEATLANAYVRGSVGIPSSGKWYFEVTASRLHNGQYCGLHGITKVGTNLRTGLLLGTNSDAGYYKNGVQVQAIAGLSLNDVLGIAVNMDSLTLQAYKNGSAWGSAITIDSATYVPHVGGNGNNLADGSQCVANFGQRSWDYSAPSGFKALNTANLPAPLVTKGSSAMTAITYTGNGSTQVITTGFSPDLVWIKSRNIAYYHRLNDSVRGAQKFLYSNVTDAEGTSTTNDRFTSFDATGFTLGSAADTSADGMNQSGLPYVAWCWDAGSSTVTNTQGSITASLRANPTAGFSVVTYTGNGTSGATFGHGLNIPLGMVVIKQRGNSGTPWDVWHSGYYVAVSKNYIRLNYTDAAGYASDMFGTPTSTLVTLGSSNSQNLNGGTYVAYCWSPVVGYSSFGSYTGNGSSSDGPFVFTGMRPRFVLLKRSDSTGNWVIWDAVRNAYNVANSIILPNTSAAEYSPDAKIDILSNGFKIRDNSSDSNVNGATYIYAAFAESPFNYARAR